MNEQLQNKLNEALEMMLQGVEKGADFLTGEVPLYVQELLLWFGMYNFIWFLAAVVTAFVWYKVEVKLYTKGKQGSWNDDDWFILYGPGSLVRIIPATIICVGMNLEWLQIWVAPRVWLVEYMSKLVN